MLFRSGGETGAEGGEGRRGAEGEEGTEGRGEEEEGEEGDDVGGLAVAAGGQDASCSRHDEGASKCGHTLGLLEWD